MIQKPSSTWALWLLLLKAEPYAESLQPGEWQRAQKKAEKFRVSNGVHSFSVSWDCWVAFQTWLDDNSIVNWKGVDGEAAINHIDISFMLSTRFAGLLECPSFVFFAVLLQSKSCLHICFTLTKASHCYRSPAVDMSVEGCANCMTNQLLSSQAPSAAKCSTCHCPLPSVKSTGLHNRTHLFRMKCYEIPMVWVVDFVNHHSIPFLGLKRRLRVSCHASRCLKPLRW